MLRLVRRHRAAGLALLVAIACGAVSSGQERMPQVLVSLGDVSLNKLIFIIAEEEGLYRKNGIDVQQFITPRAAGVVRRSGIDVPERYIREERPEQVPITVGGGAPTIVGMTTSATAVERVILSTTDHVVRWHIVARPGISKPEELKGKRIGFSGVGAMTHFSALVFAKSMGWDPRMDVSLMADALALDTLKSGRVDAFVADEVAHAKAETAGFKSVIDLSTLNSPIAGSGVNASRAWLKDNRDVARRFIKTTVDAVALLKNDKPLALRAMAKWYGVTDPREQEVLYRDVAKLPRKPYPAVDGIKKTMELYDSHEMRRRKAEDFYDDSFVRELDTSGYIDGLYKTGS